MSVRKSERSESTEETGEATPARSGGGKRGAGSRRAFSLLRNLQVSLRHGALPLESDFGYGGVVPLPKTYLESSVISYLAARPSRDIIALAHQQITREWWDRRRADFDLHVSVEVLNEIRRGDADASRLRLSYVELLPVLEADDQARALAAQILRTSALPMKAAADAMHIAIATVNGMEFLLTWNCTHIANGIVLRAITRLSREMGYEPPIVLTPEELMEG